MIDSHVHLNSSQFAGLEKTTIISAREKGITNFIIPGINIESSKKAIEIAENFVGVYSAVGVHPTEDLDSLVIEKVEMELEENIEKSGKVVAVGEVGLDYYFFKSASRLQKELLKVQLRIAVRKGLSVILHTRHATDDMLVVLAKYVKQLEGRLVFHCCEPDTKLLSFAIINNLYLGVDGDVTYDDTKKAFFSKCPLNNIVLETDSPNLLPEPLKSKKLYPNKPENLLFVAEQLAHIKKVAIDEIDWITSRNSRLLFDIK